MLTFQKPIISSQGKRNPFKRGATGASKLINNPLSHLTDKAIGFNDSQNQDSQSLNGLFPLTNESNTEDTLNSSFSNDHNDNIENQAQNTVSFFLAAAFGFEDKLTSMFLSQISTPTPVKFMDWFKDHKEEIQSEHPDVIAAELTKIAMRQFKVLQNNPKTNKRRAEDDESAAGKLAKYDFSKN